MAGQALTRGRLARPVVTTLVASVAIGVIGCKTTPHAKASKPSMQQAPAPVQQEITVTSAQAWDDLIAGNVRYAEGKAINPNRSALRRMETATGQRPSAIVLSCSDSRVPPNVVFDTGVGDLFVVRVAGNTADAAAIGSIEYAVEHLHVPLIVVMGHDRCGAVEAAVTAYRTNQAPEGHLPAVTDPILPAVDKARVEGGDLLDHAINGNVVLTVQQLQQSHPVLAEAIANKQLAVIGCRYDLKTGRVTAITPAPPTQE